MGEERHIGVAISGGGHRATAFGFGALLALVDADANSHVLSISSVSGGSITNGVTAAGPDYGTVTAEAYEAHIRPTLNVVANVGLLLGFARATKWYVIRLAALVVVGAISLLSSLVVAWFGAKSLSVALLVVGVLALVGAWLTFR